MFVTVPPKYGAAKRASRLLAARLERCGAEEGVRRCGNRGRLARPGGPERTTRARQWLAGRRLPGPKLWFSVAAIPPMPAIVRKNATRL